MAGLYSNGMPTVDPGTPSSGSYNALTGYELISADTDRPSGADPQTVAVTPFQIAAMAAYMSANTATDGGAGTATLDRVMGRVVSAALTTAAGATYTMTLTNSAVAATSNVQAAVIPGTNTTPGLVVQSVTPASGSVVFVIYNAGTAALNGTIVIVFQVQAP